MCVRACVRASVRACVSVYARGARVFVCVSLFVWCVFASASLYKEQERERLIKGVELSCIERRERQTDRQRPTETETQRDRDTYIDTDRQTNRQTRTKRDTERDRDRQTNRQTDRSVLSQTIINPPQVGINTSSQQK